MSASLPSSARRDRRPPAADRRRGPSLGGGGGEARAALGQQELAERPGAVARIGAQSALAPLLGLALQSGEEEGRRGASGRALCARLPHPAVDPFDGGLVARTAAGSPEVDPPAPPALPQRGRDLPAMGAARQQVQENPQVLLRVELAEDEPLEIPALRVTAGRHVW